MTRAYVSIGSNVEPEKHVAFAIGALRDDFNEIMVSPVYRTAAIGFEGDDFLNLVVGFETGLAVEALDRKLDKIEARAGRERSAERYAPRRLDIDLLLYGDAVIHGDNLQVPRKELTRYAFMLKPLVDLAGECKHPEYLQTFAELLEAADLSWQRCEPVAMVFD